MTIIAYDLDGVFVPDCDHMPMIYNQADFYVMASYMKPLFTPTNKNIIIITGRPTKYKYITEEWINRHFQDIDNIILHQDIKEDENPVNYKARILNLNEYKDIKYYVESDFDIVLDLKKLTKKEIIYFKSFIRQKLDTLI